MFAIKAGPFLTLPRLVMIDWGLLLKLPPESIKGKQTRPKKEHGGGGTNAFDPKQLCFES
jgi:hypothetical protein